MTGWLDRTVSEISSSVARGDVSAEEIAKESIAAIEAANPKLGAFLAISADQALEQARAADRGWDRALIDAAARRGLDEHRPGFEPESLHLVLVDDRPGVEEDRAHLVAAAPDESVRLVLTRDPSGAWGVERVD